MISNVGTFHAVGQYQSVYPLCPGSVQVSGLGQVAIRRRTAPRQVVTYAHRMGQYQSVYPLCPGSVRVSGLASRLHGLRGLGQDWLVSLFGKPQSWYDMVDKISRQLMVLQTDVAAIGKETWDRVSGELLARKQTPPGVSYFPGYDWAQEEIWRWAKKIVPQYGGPAVPDSDIAIAKQRVAEFTVMVDYVKNLVPAAAKKIAEDPDVAKMKGNISTMSKLKSPADVGVQTFKKTLEERMRAMPGSLFTGIPWYAWLGGAALVAAIVLPKILDVFGRRRSAA